MNAETNNFHNGLQIRDLHEVVADVISKGGSIACYHLKNKFLFEAK